MPQTTTVRCDMLLISSRECKVFNSNACIAPRSKTSSASTCGSLLSLAHTCVPASFTRMGNG
eukprot:3172116-Amphidinium_carterae.1